MKQFTISKPLVVQAYKAVKASAGAAGIDEQTLGDFDKNLKDNLYKLWNRMSSGSYMPEVIKAVAIPKKQGGERVLGIPTVTDRIAQMIVKLTFEPNVEPCFYSDSYGYIPNKSALDAIGITRQRCWKYKFLIEFDIKGLFDNIDHELLMKAVRKHTNNKWVILYITRWLKVPMQLPDGTIKERTKGIPQGGVISPVLSNLFLHYVFDVWMNKHHSNLPWCRYADDGLIHCHTEQQAKLVLIQLTRRFKECKLEIHSDKTKIVYCKDDDRKENYPNTSFEFLGYCFRRRKAFNSKSKKLFMSFTPGVSKNAIKSMRAKIRRSNIRNRADKSLSDIAKEYNPILRGWIQYYGCYNRWAMSKVLRHFNLSLISWARRKFRKLKTNQRKAAAFIRNIAEREPQLFAHWQVGIVSTFA
nr:group II intron reverse transcriptase/maturase [Rickettsia endosymbiont of Ceutorhynchus assimilis]